MKNLNSKIKEWVQFVPLLILLLISINTIYIVLTTNYSISLAHYIGLSLVLITSVVFFFSRYIGNIFILVLLLAGMVNAIEFSQTTTQLNINFLSLSVTIQPYILGVLILFVVINFKLLISWFKK